VKRADFIRNWRISGLKNPDKPKNLMKKNVINHSYHQFWRRSGLTEVYFMPTLNTFYCTTV